MRGTLRAPAFFIILHPSAFILYSMCMPTKPKGARLAGVPGPFDPITNGHLDVIRRGVKLFDELIVAVGVNPDKREMFSLRDRSDMIRALLRGVRGVRVEQYTGLTMDFVRQVKA